MLTLTAITKAACATLPLLCLSMTGCDGGNATLTVDEGQRYQSIAGWEATARGWEFDKVNDRFDGSVAAHKERLATLLADDAGIDRLRLEIKSGMENPVDYWALFASGRLSYGEYRRHFYDKINDNADPAVLDPNGVHFSDLDWHVENLVLPVKRRVEARGRRFRLNLAYVDFKWTDAKGTLSHARNPAEYAEFVTAAFEHLKTKYGLQPDSLEIIVEPDNTDDWDGLAIGHAIVAASERLEKSGFQGVEMIAPSTAKAQRALKYLADIRTVPGAVERLNTLSYHRYDGEPRASDLADIAKAAGNAGMRTAMLEYVDADMTDLLADLTAGGVSAWQQYGIAARAPDDGAPKPGWLIRARGNPVTSLSLSPAARALALVFGNVDAGSVRVGAASSSGNLPAVAFVTPKRKLVLVFHAKSDIHTTITGVPTGAYRLLGVDAAGHGSTTRSVKVQGALKVTATDGATYALIES